MSNNPHNLSVGQKLFYVSNGRDRDKATYEIEKVGRTWATMKKTNGMRISLVTLKADGGVYSSPGRCYLKEQDYHDECERNALLKKIRDYSWMETGSLDDVRAAAKLLGVPNV